MSSGTQTSHFRSATAQNLSRFGLLIILFTLFAAAGPGARAQETDPADVIKVNTDLVVFDVQVVDKKTKKIAANLRAEDFEIRDRSTKQTVSYFSHDELPLSIMLLLDVSDSVRPFVRRIRDGALDALRHLKEQDQVAVMAFATASELVQDFSADRNLVASQIDKATSGERLGAQTAFAKALTNAATAMLNPPHGNRAVIIVVTDNFFFTYEHQEKLILAELFKSGAVVYGLTVNSSNPVVALRGGYYPGLERFVKQTGGEIVSADDHQVAEKLALLIDRLRQRYAVGFRPSDMTEDGKFRPVQITLTADQEADKNAVVLTRRGYYFRRRK